MTDTELSSARNLLARIHRDGGQLTAERGFEESCKAAEQIVIELQQGFTRAQVQPIVGALVQLYEMSASVPSEAKAIARDALDYAGRLGF